jgi:tetratricopeptide (TPR) repeat protein
MAQRGLIALPSPNPGAKGVLAKVAGSRHRFSESIQIALDMLKENAGNDGAMAILATDYLATGDLAKAAEYADQVVTLKPLSANIALRALVLLAQGRDDEAVFEFQNALAKEQFGEGMESSWIRAVFGRYYLKRGNLRVARELFQESLRITPEFALALDLMGQLEAREGHFAKAESYFNEAFAVSRQIPYLIHLAMATEEKGERGSADALRTQAEELVRRELGSASYGHRLDLARLLIEKGTPAALAEAVKLAQEETHVRQNSETYFTLSQALSRSKRWAEARGAIFAALRSGVRDPDYFYQASEVERQIGSVTRSDFYRGEVRRLDPSYKPSEEKPVIHLTQNP